MAIGRRATDVHITKTIVGLRQLDLRHFLPEKELYLPKAITLPKPWPEILLAYGGEKFFAEKLGVNKTTIYRWAHKHSKMSLATQNEVKRLAKAKGIKFESL